MPQRLLLPLLGAVASLIATVLLTLATDAVGFSILPSMILIGLVFGQTTLASLWLALGRAPLLVRCAVSLAIAAALAGPLAASTNPNWAESFGMLGLTMLFTTPLPAVLRLAGWLSVARSSDEPRSDAPPALEPPPLETPALETLPFAPPTPPPATRWQFSVWSVLVLMTALSLPLAALRAMQFPWEHTLVVLSYCVGFAAIGLLAPFAVFPQQNSLVRLLALLVMTPLVGAGVAMLEPYAFGYLICIVAAQAVWLVAAAVVLRVAGYRLRWRLPGWL